jgi:hypothetical protein
LPAARIRKRCDASNAESSPSSTAECSQIKTVEPNEIPSLLDTQRRPFEQDAANLFFQLVSSRYEHASLILTSNLPFARWGDVFGDQVVAAAMIDRIVHHAEVLTLKGSSHRLKRHRNRHTALRTRRQHGTITTPPWPTFRPSPLA